MPCSAQTRPCSTPTRPGRNGAATTLISESLADPRFAAAQIAASREEFFATGDAFISGLLAKIEHHFGPVARGRALDHGCGVGRLSLPLAAAFREVVALDVAPAMLDEARANAAQAKVANITFRSADDGLATADGSFDFVNSHLVLQHVPVARGLAIFDSLIDRVAPGGAFHITFGSHRSRGSALAVLGSANIPGVKYWQNICAGRAWNAPAMQMNDYPLSAR